MRSKAAPRKVREGIKQGGKLNKRKMGLEISLLETYHKKELAFSRIERKHQCSDQSLSQMTAPSVAFAAAGNEGDEE